MVYSGHSWERTKTGASSYKTVNEFVYIQPGSILTVDFTKDTHFLQFLSKTRLPLGKEKAETITEFKLKYCSYQTLPPRVLAGYSH